MASLANGEQLAARYPEFHTPSASERHSLKPGDFAKLVFVGAEQRERMWVRVSLVDDKGYAGTLDNTPLNPALGKRGDVVLFQPKHVIDVARSSRPQGGAIDNFASATRNYNIASWLVVAGTLWWAFQRDRRRRR